LTVHRYFNEVEQSRRQAPYSNVESDVNRVTDIVFKRRSNGVPVAPGLG